MIQPSNAYFAISVGALRTLYQQEPAPHTRRARKLHALSTKLVTQFRTLPPVAPEDVDDYTALFDLVELTIDEFAADEGCSTKEALISLVCFCTEELPNKRQFAHQMAGLLECYPTADTYEIALLGDRAYQRMQKEIERAHAEEVDILPVLV